MALYLSTTNIDVILTNISCCIRDLAEKQILFAATGNIKCLKDVRNQTIILDRIYEILYQNYATAYPTACFTTAELEDLYQIALRLCKICNCNK